MNLYQPTITGSLSVSGSVNISGSITIAGGGTISGTASYATNAELLDGLDSTVFTLTSSFAAQTASFTAFTSSILSYTASQNILNGTYTLTSSFAAQTASFTAFTASILAQTASLNSFSASVLSYTSSLNAKTSSFATTGSNTFEGIQTVNSNLIVTGSITAQTLVVQTITSSVDFVTGSTRFGSISANTHVFTGSLFVTGAFYVASGSVGIGTISPSNKLEVSGSIRATSQGDPTSGVGAELFYRAADTSSYIQSYDRTNSLWKDVRIYGNALYFGTQGNNSLTINVSGSVGIGTSSPGAKVEIESVRNSTLLRLTATSGESWDFKNTNTAGSTDFLSIGAAGATANLNLKDDGNVGIGTTSFTGWSSTMVLRIQGFSGSTTSVLQALSYDSGSGVWMYSGASSVDHPSLIYLKDLRFGSATDLGTGGYNERMRITSTGNVGIGTTSPSRALEVVASADSTPAIRVSRYGNSAQYLDITAGGADVTFTSRATAESQFSFISDNSGTQTTRLFISQAGHVIKPYQPYFKYGVAYTGTITSAVRFGTNYGFTVKTDRDAVDSSYFNKATGLFTAPIAGVYIFGCTIMRSGTSGTGPVDIWICKNPSSLTARNNSYGRGYAGSYSTDYQQITIVVPIKLAVNDTVALGMQGNMTVYDDDSWFYGYLLG